jgi:O-antigen/teichoic acid export membrane protein
LAANIAKNVVLFAVLWTATNVFPTANFGAISLGLAITTPFFAFALIGARVLRLTANTKLDLVSIELALVVTGGAALVGSTMFAFVFTAIPPFSAAPDLVISSVVAIGIYKWADIYSELYAGELQLSLKTAKLLFAGLVSGVTVSTLVFLVAIFKFEFQVLLLTVAGGGIFTAMLFATIARSRTNLTSVSVITVFRLGLPLGMAGAVGTFLTAAPQYLVAGHFGPERLGTLAIILYVYSIADLLGGAYGQAWIRRIRAIPNQVTQLKSAINIGLVSSLAILPVAVIGVAIFSFLAPAIFGNSVKLDVIEQIPLVVAITLLPIGHLVSVVLLVRIQYKLSFAIVVLTAFSVVVSSIIWVPTFGVAGALWAVAFGAFTRTAAPVLISIYRLQSKAQN